MGKVVRHVYILALKDIVVFAGSNLKVVYYKFVAGVPVELRKGIKSYEQYSRDILKCSTIEINCPYYGMHTITKLPIISNLKPKNNEYDSASN